MPKPQPSTFLCLASQLRRPAVARRLSFKTKRFSLQMKICVQIRNRPASLPTRKRQVIGFARQVSPMAGMLPVTTIDKVNNHECIHMRCCRDFDVLCHFCIDRRDADESISNSQNHNPRYRYVDRSRSGPACSQDFTGGAWSMRHRKPAFQSGYKAKTADMPRRNLVGGICGCQRYSGCKNGAEVKSSPSEGAIKCRRCSFWAATTPAVLQW